MYVRYEKLNLVPVAKFVHCCCSIFNISMDIPNHCIPTNNKHFEPVLVCCGFFLTVR